jgi:hypothetical protein
MTMLLARGVKVGTIIELLAAGLANKKSEVVGCGRLVPDTAWLDPLIGRAALRPPASG